MNPCASQAASKQVMLYWLQQLQTKRWEFHHSPPAPPATPATALAAHGPALHLEPGTKWVRLLPAPLGLRATKPFPSCWERVGGAYAKEAKSQGGESGSGGTPHSLEDSNRGSEARRSGFKS